MEDSTMRCVPVNMLQEFTEIIIPAPGLGGAQGNKFLKRLDGWTNDIKNRSEVEMNLELGAARDIMLFAVDRRSRVGIQSRSRVVPSSRRGGFDDELQRD